MKTATASENHSNTYALPSKRNKFGEIIIAKKDFGLIVSSDTHTICIVIKKSCYQESIKT